MHDEENRHMEDIYHKEDITWKWIISVLMQPFETQAQAAQLSNSFLIHFVIIIIRVVIYA